MIEVVGHGLWLARPVRWLAQHGYLGLARRIAFRWVYVDFYLDGHYSASAVLRPAQSVLWCDWDWEER